MTTQTYRVTGMSCQSCRAKVTNALEGLVHQVEVRRNPDVAVLEGGQAHDLTALNAALARTGGYRLEAMYDVADKVDGSAAVPTAAVMPEGLGVNLATYRPLLLVVGLALLLATLLALRTLSPAVTPATVLTMQVMNDFMGTFFLLFGFFKLLDPQGFVQAYRRYDVLAWRSTLWARAYPYVEIALGLLFIAGVAPVLANGLTLVLMLVGLIGVAQTLRRGEVIQCACLGTVFNLPMTTVTVVENGGMAAMAALMLVL